MTPADFESKVALITALMEDGQHYDAAQEIPAIVAHARRLQDLLDCETGKRAPYGWEFHTGRWVRGNIVCTKLMPGCWHECMYGRTFTYALEAIEAADKVTP